MPYKYTGKEYDPETKLTYYGARYYGAKLSRWISVDPPLITGECLPQPGGDGSQLPDLGGVFNPINLDAYQYGGMNPVKYIDAGGNAMNMFWNMASGEVKAVMSLQNALVGKGNGEYFAEYSGINSSYAYIGGMACGVIDTYLGFSIGKVGAMDGKNQDLLRKHKRSFDSGYSHWSKVTQAYNTVMFTQNIKKYAGKKLTAGVVRQQLKDIARDPVEFKHFTNGFIKGIAPEGNTNFKIC